MVKRQIVIDSKGTFSSRLHHLWEREHTDDRWGGGGDKEMVDIELREQ